MKIVIVIPTSNEAQNLPKLISALFVLPLDLFVLIVDDNSPGGTRLLANELAASTAGRQSVLHHTKRLGISSAYVQGFRCALENNADAICQMDADFSHNPAILITMAKCLETYDVVFGSRYAPTGSVDNEWPLWRKGLSAWGDFYAPMILRVPVRDITTGYHLWRAETLRGIPFEKIQSKGFIFQVEMAYLAHCLEYRLYETPIYFADRHLGKSKMSLQIQMDAALRVWQIWLTHRHLCHICSAPRIQQSGVVT